MSEVDNSDVLDMLASEDDGLMSLQRFMNTVLESVCPLLLVPWCSARTDRVRALSSLSTVGSTVRCGR